MNTIIWATNIKIKKDRVSLILQSSAKIYPRKISFTYQNATCSYSWPAAFSLTQKKGTEIHAQISLKELNLQTGDWNIAVNLGTEDAPQILFPVLSKSLRLRLILMNYECRPNPDMILFPMGGDQHKLILRCRPVSPYDGFCTKLKIFLAFGASKLLRPFMKQKNIWLVYEKFCCTAQENGYYFFKYCMEQLSASDSRNIYFILDKTSPQWPSMQKYKDHMIPFMSFRHLLYALTAQLYISPDGKAHLFAWKPKPNPISRELNRHDLFFLQHGVLALKRVDHLFGKTGVSPMTYFTTSSKFEQDIVVKNMGYQPEEAPVLGLARWDTLEDLSANVPANILVMPTWRDWLEGQNDEFFQNSDYYKHYMSLIHNKELLSLLKAHKITLVFHIHPKLHEFLHNFQADSNLVKLIPFNTVPINRLIMECSMMITDYSSACWDVYYQEKPILFYHFDNDLHEQARGSYIDMEHELFGDRCMTEEQLVACIREYIENGFREKALYGNMRKKYFAYRDHNNCQRTYDFIAERYKK